jgi:hypothetical protein
MNLHRNFGVPVYVPPSKYGDATINDAILPSPEPNAMTSSEKRWSLVPALIFAAFAFMLIGYTATSLWYAYAAYVAHERTCALSHHTFTNCGE